MSDTLSASSGGSIISSSCHDEKFPPHAIIDDNARSAWVTTGMFPHEVVIRCGKLGSVSTVSLRQAGVKSVRVERCAENSPTSWETVAERELPDTGIATEDIAFPAGPAQFIKLIIYGWGNFAAIYSATASSK